MRRRIHACHMRRRIHACHEEEDTCMSYMRRRTHACHMRRRIHACGRTSLSHCCRVSRCSAVRQFMPLQSFLKIVLWYSGSMSPGHMRTSRKRRSGSYLCGVLHAQEGESTRKTEKEPGAGSKREPRGHANVEMQVSKVSHSQACSKHSAPTDQRTQARTRSRSRA